MCWVIGLCWYWFWVDFVSVGVDCVGCNVDYSGKWCLGDFCFVDW